MSAPIVMNAGRNGWLETVVTAAVFCLLSELTFSMRQEHDESMPPWLCLVQILWLCVILAQTGRQMLGIWPEANHRMLVPVLLIGMGALCAKEGSGASARCSSTLWWLLLLIYSLVLFSGIKDIRGPWLLPAWRGPSPGTAVVFLFPALLGFLPAECTGPARRGFLWVWLFAAAAGIWTVGTLSPQVAAGSEWPFHESCKSLNLFGAAERFEAFASAAVTMGYYSLGNLMLSVCGSLGEQAKQGSGKRSIILAAMISGIFLWIMPELDGYSQIIGSIILWVVLPTGGICKRKRKNLKKDEKSA